jgi:plasmid stabilization system protein ParE
MTWTLRVPTRARLEIIEIAEWYASQGPGLAESFVRALDGIFERITDNPLQYQIVHGELRRAGVHRFPYLVIYTELTGEVVVLGCIHGRRHPRHWRDRKPE